MNADELAIRNVIATWHRASAQGDVENVMTLMSEDVVFLVAGKPPMRGRIEFEKGLRDLLQSHRLESTFDIQEISVAGDLACAISHLDIRVIPLAGGDAMARSGHVLSIFRKQADGSWLLTRDANLMPPPG